MSDYHREYADQADARIRELEDKLAGAVEVLNGAGVKMCELIDQLAAYKVAVGKMVKYINASACYSKDFEHMRDEVLADSICKAAFAASKGGG